MQSLYSALLACRAAECGSTVEMPFSGDQIFWNLLERLHNIFPCGFLVLAQVVFWQCGAQWGGIWSISASSLFTALLSGVSSEGFMTIVHPTARAGATFPENQINDEKRDNVASHELVQ
jgi:hypothetical protein